MSKLIVEMEMPKNCHECEAQCVSALYGRICGMTRKNIMPFLDKPNSPDWCPIVGVLPDVPDKDRQSVLDFLRECRADWIHDPSVGLFGPNEEEAALMDAIEAALEVAEKQQ